MTKRRSSLVRLGVLLSALAIASPVAADGTADEADLHFDLGLAAFGRGDHSAALVHFFYSNRLVPNRNVLYNVARTYEAMKRYADAHRYYVDAREGETDPKKKADADAAIVRLAPNVAVLNVITSPPGATIYIDRKDLGSRGNAPRLLALPPGKYKVIAELNGYETAASAEVSVQNGKEVKVTLDLPKITGIVRVDVKGTAHANVRADDDKGPIICSAPCDAPLSPGRHDLYFDAPGFDAPPRSVVVKAGETTTTVAQLAPRTGSVVVRADELGAEVIVDDKPMGFTPVVLQNVPVGLRTIRVRMRGFADYETKVEVRPREQSVLPEISLEPAREVNAVSRSTETIDDAPSSVSIIDHREIEALGYPTIAEALRGVRGIALTNDHAYSSVSIRGIGQAGDYGNRLLVLSDGASLNDNLLASSYIGSDGRTDMHDIDRIEVVRGPGSLLYGTGAFSGLVNLVTRPREEPSNVHAGFGGYDNSVLHGRVGGHLHFNKDGGVWASVAGARSEGYSLPIPALGTGGVAPVIDNTDAFFAGTTAGRFYYKSFTLQWLYHHREQHIPIGAYGTRVNDPASKFNDTRGLVEARFEPRLSEKWQILARAHANRYEFHSDYSFENESNFEDLVGTWLGAEARIVFNPVPWLKITAGGEGQYHPDVTLKGRTESVSGTKIYLDESAPYQFGAGYALIEGTPASWLKFSAGARVDVYSTFGPIVVPRAALIFKPRKGSVLKVLGGRAFRAPSIYEQVYNDGGASEVPATDPSRGLSLGPESVYSGELEYSQRFAEDWVAVAAGHASYIEGIMTFVPDTPTSTLVRYANSDSPALVVGGDVELRREWRRGFMLSASYGYQQARYLEDVPNPRLVNAPEHYASLRTVVPLIKELVSLGGRLTLEAPRRIRADSDQSTQGTLVADAALSGFVRDIGVRYVLGVYNIADKRYDVPVADTFATRTLPQNGRSFRIDTVWTWP